MKRICLSILSLFLVNILLAGNAPAQSTPGIQVVHSGGKVSVVENGETVLAYQQSATVSDKNSHQRAHYVHPLLSLDGEVITEDFPDDHLHHRGVFWAWHQVLVSGKLAGDAWLCQKFQWRTAVNSIETNGEQAIIDATAIWTSDDIKSEDGQLTPIATDNVRITIYSKKKRYRVVDFRIEVTALVDELRVGGSDDAKGYGGFSPRIKLNEDQRFIGRNGAAEPIITAVEAGPWIAIADDNRGIAFIAHPENPSPNESWILRRKGSMQSAAYPGRKAVHVKRESPLTLRYRTVLFGKSSAEEIKSLMEEQLVRFAKRES